MNHRRLIITLVGINGLASAAIGFVLLQQSGLISSSVKVTENSLLAQFVPDSPDISSRRSSQLQDSQRLQPISTRQAISAISSSQRNKIVFYEKTTGKVFETMVDQLREQIVSDARLNGFLKTIWAPNTQEVVSEFSSGNRFRYFNYQTKQVSLFPPGTQSVAFSPENTKVAYFRTEGDSGSLFLAQSDGSYASAILATRITNMILNWIAPNAIALEITQADPSLKELWTITPEGALTRILETKNNMEIVWAPSGEQFIFSAKDEEGQNKLYKKSRVTLEEQELPIFTKASKCAWSKGETFVICAVSQESGSDRFVDIDIKTLTVTPLFSGGLNDPTLSVTEPFFAPGEHYLIFKNGLDNLLYSLELGGDFGR